MGFKFGGLPLPGTYTDNLAPVIIGKDISKETHANLVNTLVDALFSQHHYAEFKLFYKNSINLEDLKKSFFKRITRSHVSTIIIDLSLPEEELWKGVKSKTRNIIRKANKKEISLRKVDSGEKFVKSFFPLLDETFLKRGQKSPHGYETFFNLLTGKLSKNFDCFEASSNDEIVSAAIFLRVDSSTVLFFAGASNDMGLKIGASAAVQWEAIKFYKRETNLSFYDLGGLGVPSIDRFKKGFGGKEIVREKLIISKPFIEQLVVLGKNLIRLGLLSSWRR